MQNIRLPTREAELLRLYKGDYSWYVFYYGDKTLNMLVCFTNTEFPVQFFNKDSHREVTKFSLKIELTIYYFRNIICLLVTNVPTASL